MMIVNKLTALKVAREKQPGLYGDGGGLYLQITERGSKIALVPAAISRSQMSAEQLPMGTRCSKSI